MADDVLLSVEEAGHVLGTGVRFPRRLISERRIRFVRVGRHVRIPRSALDEFMAAGTVEPITLRGCRDSRSPVRVDAGASVWANSGSVPGT